MDNQYPSAEGETSFKIVEGDLEIKLVQKSFSLKVSWIYLDRDEARGWASILSHFANTGSLPHPEAGE